MSENGGAYLLFIRVPRLLCIRPGKLGQARLKPGLYVYVGSAKRGLRQRVARHARLARQKRGNRHWHVDALLLHGWTRLERTELRAGGDECSISAALAASGVATVPVPGFGATDCSRGCAAHLYRLHGPWPEAAA